MLRYYLAGIILGDGNIERNWIRISTSSEFHKEIILKQLEALQIRHKVHWDKTSKVFRIRLKDTKLLQLLTLFNATTSPKTFTFRLDSLDSLKKEERVMLISGIIDAEGWVENDKGSLRIRFKIKNKQARDKIAEVLRKLNIQFSLFERNDKSYGLTIQRKDSLSKFLAQFYCPLILFKLLRLLAEAPNALGYTRHTTGATMGCDPERGSKSPKSAPSSDRGLQLALVKPEFRGA